MAHRALGDSPNQCAAFSIASGGTPVTSAARRGSQAAADSARLLEAGGVRVDELAVLEAVAHDHVQHRQQQRESVPGRTGR